MEHQGNPAMNKKLAIPIRKNSFCSHFGDSDEFMIVDFSGKAILKEDHLTPPPHEPGIFPGWLAEKGVTHIIAGGMGRKALAHFQHLGITPIVGVDSKPVNQLIEEFLNDELKTDFNKCRHH